MVKFGLRRLVHGSSPLLLQAIGDVVVSYAHLQWTVELVIQNLLAELSHEKQGVITANLDFSAAVQLMDTLYVHHEPKPIPYEQFRELLGRLDKLREERNRLNHAMIFAGQNDLELLSFDRRKRGQGLRVVKSERTLSEIEKLASEMQMAGGDLTLLLNGLHQGAA